MQDNAERPLVNYHTHTWRCRHATGVEAGYVRQAIQTGFDTLGFSDHSPWPDCSEYVAGVRMRLDQFGDYLRTVRALADRYRDSLYIPVGLECEAFSEHFGWLRDIRGKYLDYLLLGNHYEPNVEAGGFYFGRCARPEHIARYAETAIEGLRTGLFDCFAHPDLFCQFYRKFDADCAAASRDLCAAARELNIPLEYNLLGLENRDAAWDRGCLGYPCTEFWEIAAETGCRAIIGFDAHCERHLASRRLFDQALADLTALGIEVLPRLPGLEPR